MNDFLLELLVEEIPARFQSNAIENFEHLMLEELGKHRIEYKGVKSYITPRRIIFSAQLSTAISKFREERRGPQITAPLEVKERFMQSIGVSKENCEEKTINNKTFIVAYIEHKECKTADILGTIVKNAIMRIPWPKSMHWGNNSFSFVRPLRNIMCFFSGMLVDVDFKDEMNLKSADYTFGHRFLCYKKVAATNIADYISKMRESFVIIDQEERRRIILDACSSIHSIQKGLTACISKDLLDEVVGLVEYPVVLVGKIPEKFMKLPEEVIITPMQAHQRYFPTKIDNKLAPYFVFVANNVTSNQAKTIIAGNERVLNARLADAFFFFEMDLQNSLESRLENLKKIVFNEDLGTVYDRVYRIKNICNYLCDEINNISPINHYREILERAALLSKCDLSTNMVCEFTELQGIMGAHYARLQGEAPEICEIIRDQYKSVDEINAFLSALFSIADKIDMITSLFAIGKEPTGSKDPFALRRAALGIIKLIKKYNININLKTVINKSFEQLNVTVNSLKQDTVDKVMSFIIDRLRVLLKDLSISHEVAFAVTSTGDNILNSYEKAIILNEALKDVVGEKLIAMYKRAKNITKDNIYTEINSELFERNEEKLLYDAVNDLEFTLHKIDEDSNNHIEKFKSKVAHCIYMEETVSNFFNEVLVNADDEKIRQNRISILNRFIDIFDRNLPEISLLG